MINSILIVCIGNICRSPMAEGLFQAAFPDKEIVSAGVSAQAGRSAADYAVKVMQKNGIDISRHRSRLLSAEMIKRADLVVTMDLEQKRYVEVCFPSAKGKVMRLGEFSGYDIPDPYQMDEEDFCKTFDLIAKGLDELAEQIALIV